MHEPQSVYGAQSESGPGPLARLIAFIISAGLAWAIVLAICAWLVGLVFARG